VAGQFYEGTPGRLEKQVRSLLAGTDAARTEAFGVVAPHAGFVYSGSVAGAVFARVEIPGTVLLVGPNHTGLGAPLSVMSFGEWELPNGTVSIDGALAGRLLEEVPPLEEDEQAHVLEHSLEVQLPFIVERAPGTRIVPVVMADTSLGTCRVLGEAVGRILREDPGRALVVASSDMSHYLPDAEARRRDRPAIERMLALDPEGLHRVVRENRISMCGFAPVTALLFAARAAGAASAELVDYRTSGEVNGDLGRVVGYAGVIIRR